MNGQTLRTGALAFATAFPLMFAAPLLLRLVQRVEPDYDALALWAIGLGLVGSAAASAVGATVGARAGMRRDPSRDSRIRTAAAAGATLLVLSLGILAVLLEPAAAFVNGLAVLVAALAAWVASGRAVRRRD